MSSARAYYNEIDKHALRALRAMMAAGHIAPGDIDERDIRYVRPEDLRGYTQCHFFAGIGGWSLACRLAGWPDNRRCWTGSCPCQPFSKVNTVYGRKGREDERHLLPEWLRLIKAERPDVVFGEQVTDVIAFGWLDELFGAVERDGYACGAVRAAACSVGSPQERERLWFVCDADEERYEGLGIAGTLSSTREAIAPWRSAVRTGGSYRGKQWLSEPGLCRLVDGVSDPQFVGVYGNAIVPQLGAEIIATVLEAERLRLIGHHDGPQLEGVFA